MIPSVFKKSDVSAIIFGVALVLIAGLRPVGVDHDSHNYFSVSTKELSSSDLLALEPSFIVLVQTNKWFFGGSITALFLIYALLGVTLKIFCIRKMSLAPNLSYFLYFSLYFVLHEMTQIRVGVASAIILLGLYDLSIGRRSRFLLKVLIATLFHYSAVVALLALTLKPNRVSKPVLFALPFLGIAGGIFFPVHNFMLISISLLPEFLSYKLGLYLSMLSEGKLSEINVFNYYYISLVALYLIIVSYSDYLIMKTDVLFLKVFGLMLFLYFFFMSFPVLAFRISELFGIVLVVLLANFSVCFELEERRVYALLLSVFALLYFLLISVGQNLNLGMLL